MNNKRLCFQNYFETIVIQFFLVCSLQIFSRKLQNESPNLFKITTMLNSINETIRILRTLRQYKQSFMASKLGISQQDYSYLESHGRKITEDQIILICEILEVNQDFIMQFNSTLFFKQIQREETNIVLPEGLLRGIDDKDEVTIALKAHITRLLENIHGLRNQVKEQNETIKDLRQALLKKMGGGGKIQQLQITEDFLTFLRGPGIAWFAHFMDSSIFVNVNRKKIKFEMHLF